MWEVRNRTPFTAAGAFARDVNGQESWCVAVRATCDIDTDGTLRISDTQEDVRLAPLYLDADNEELISEPDITGFATGTDVLINGTIRVPEKRMMQLPLSLQIGKLAKQSRLTGPRTARRGLLGWRIDDAQPITDTLLSWQNSYGGTLPAPFNTWHPANPVGRGIEMQLGSKVERGTIIAMPQIEAIKGDAIDDPNNTAPTGFGPVARHWQPRLALAGTYDDAWEKGRAPLLPQDFDPVFLNTAPVDQQIKGFVKGGEQVSLQGFTPDGPLAFRLPQVILTAQTLFRGRPIETRFTALRVEVTPDTRRLALVWVTTVPCNGDDAGIQRTTVRVKQISGVTT